MQTTTLGPRPAAHLISFAEECFEVVGYETTYVVPTKAPGVKREYATREQAIAWASARGLTVHERKTAIRRRVKWN